MYTYMFRQNSQYINKYNFKRREEKQGPREEKESRVQAVPMEATLCPAHERLPTWQVMHGCLCGLTKSW